MSATVQIVGTVYGGTGPSKQVQATISSTASVLSTTEIALANGDNTITVPTNSAAAQTGLYTSISFF